MNHLEFLEDTIQYYSVDPKGRRAVNERGVCKYRIFDKDDNVTAKCAIGRYIPDRKYNSGVEGLLISELQFNKTLSAKIRPLNTEFLIAVQRLHDGLDYGRDAGFWDVNGLTEKGQEKADELRKWAKELDG